MQLRFMKLDKEAIIPTRATLHSAGIDLYSLESLTIYAGAVHKVKTGIACEIPQGYWGDIRPRSGKATKEGLILRSSNVVDADYRGEIMLCCYNLSNLPMSIAKGERIAQMLIMPVTYILIEEATSLSETVRGTGGFGSTGKSV
jgi:dUTP pyrophosphatase